MIKVSGIVAGIITAIFLSLMLLAETMTINADYKYHLSNIESKQYKVVSAKEAIEIVNDYISRNDAKISLSISKFITISSTTENVYISDSRIQIEKIYYICVKKSDYIKYRNYLKKISSKYYKNPLLIKQAD